MASSYLFLTLAISIALLLPPAGASLGIIIARNLTSHSQLLRRLHSQNISSAMVYHSNSSVLSAFSGSGISFTLTLPNALLPSAANSSSFTDSWLHSILLPSASISAIAVGDDVFSSPALTASLLPAMENLYSSLLSTNLHTRIKITSPLALSSAIVSSYPPSAGAFTRSLVPSVLPVLSFLRRTSSFLMVNAGYPFLDHAGGANPVFVDPQNGLKYSNLFDAQIDAVYTAMSALHFPNIAVVVTATGWPAYNVLNGGGTPLRPNRPVEVFFSLTSLPLAASAVAIAPPSPTAAIRSRQQLDFGAKAKGKADKLPRDSPGRSHVSNPDSPKNTKKKN